MTTRLAFQYNGVNLRNAKEEQARVIMSQTHPGDNIKLLAQYNLESKSLETTLQQSAGQFFYLVFVYVTNGFTAEYKQSIESNLSDTLGVAKPIIPNGNAGVEEREERTITPDLTPRARCD